MRFRILLFLLFTLVNTVSEQTKFSSNKLQIEASILLKDGVKPAESIVKIYESDSLYQIIKLNKKRRFSFKLDFGKEFIIELSHNGYTSRSIIINTEIPSNLYNKNFNPIAFELTLSKTNEDSINAIRTHKIYYSKKINDFDYKY